MSEEHAAAQIIDLLGQLPSDEARERALVLVRRQWCLDCGRLLKSPRDWCFCQNDD